MDRQKIKNGILIMLICLSCVTAGAAGGYLSVSAFVQGRFAGQDTMEQGKEEEYLLFIGLNDKETCRQYIPTEEARKIIDAVCVKYVGGYTSVQAKGGWVDEKGVLTQENTLIYCINGADEKVIRDIMKEILPKLNQNSILLEKRHSNYTLYDGTNKENQ